MNNNAICSFQSAESKKLLEMFRSFDLKNNKNLDDLERCCSDFIAKIRNEIVRRYGIKEQNHWDSQGPMCGKFGQVQPYNRCVDHHYRQYYKGNKVYISEPYEIDSESILWLAQAMDAGWGIMIEADRARWYPGNTLRIEFRRKAKGDRHEERRAQKAE